MKTIQCYALTLYSSWAADGISMQILNLLVGGTGDSAFCLSSIISKSLSYHYGVMPTPEYIHAAMTGFKGFRGFLVYLDR